MLKVQIIINPPYSIKWEGDANPLLINDPRFSPAGVLAPKSKADLAFIMHSLAWLANNGAAAIVCFPGVMYRGGAEQKIRKYLIDNNFVDCIIQLPDNLFFGTSIATCIMVLKKNKSENSTLFIDASKDFVKQKARNYLSDDNVEKIFKAYVERKDVEKYAHLASYDEIVENEFNLNIPRYVDTTEDEAPIDLQSEFELRKKLNDEEKILNQELNNYFKELGLNIDLGA